MEEKKPIDVSEGQAPPENEKKHKKKHPPATPIAEPALPLLVCTVSFAICFIILIIDRFIRKSGGELLAPVILQIAALVIPSYLAILLTSSKKSVYEQMKETGFRLLRAKYIFLVLFASLFTICMSAVLTLMFGGAYDMSRGITLLGTFTAGENEFSVSPLYLILTYAVIPAFAEELLFRGVIFSGLCKVSYPFAATVSVALYALFGFSLGGLISSIFVGMMLTFVMYTSRSIFACVALHFLFNLYRLFLEANISAYFLASQNNILLLITLALMLCLSALLFFSETARIYRRRAKKISENREKSASKFANIHSVKEEIRGMLAYKPNLVFVIICSVLFLGTVAINLFV